MPITSCIVTLQAMATDRPTNRANIPLPQLSLLRRRKSATSFHCCHFHYYYFFKSTSVYTTASTKPRRGGPQQVAIIKKKKKCLPRAGVAKGLFFCIRFSNLSDFLIHCHFPGAGQEGQQVFKQIAQKTVSYSVINVNISCVFLKI